MWFGARLPGAQFAFLTGLSATSGTPYHQGLFLGDFHSNIIRVYSTASWSILTSPEKLSDLLLESGNGVPQG